MAKSIRSKVKKRNRTEMRKTVGDPHQKKLQARCTAKIQKAVAFSAGESVAKLKGMLTAAQDVNPAVKPVSKHGFIFRHPDAPPPFVEDDDVPAPSPRRSRGRGRARSVSDAEASMVDEDTAMGDSPAAAGEGGEDGAGGGVADAEGRKATDLATKLKKKRRQAKRRNWVEFPAHEN